MQHRLYPCHRIVPTKPERGHQFISGTRGLRRKNKNRDEANQKKLAEHRLVRAGNVHRNTLSGNGIDCLHLQLAERLPYARGGGKFHAQASSVNSAFADERQRNPSGAVIPNRCALACARFFRQLFFFSHRRAPSIFSVKKIFLSKLKIKFIFFLSLS